jgi:CDP-diacylglycerol--glycerol-3-phosphate 3-phosphatidyltransferase
MGWGLGFGTGQGTGGLASGLHQLGWWLFWPSLLLALSSAWSYLRQASTPPLSSR